MKSKMLISAIILTISLILSLFSISKPANIMVDQPLSPPELIEFQPIPPVPLAKLLNLSREQIETIRPIHRAFTKNALNIRKELTKKQFELSRLLTQPEPARKKIYQKIDELATIRAKLQKQAIDFLFDIKPILTPQQQTKLFNIVADQLSGIAPPKAKLRRFPHR